MQNHQNPDFTYFPAPEILVVIICVSVSCLVLLRGHEVWGDTIAVTASYNSHVGTNQDLLKLISLTFRSTQDMSKFE